jgi:hypothetical protein
MNDLIYVAVILVSFLGLFGLIRAFEALQGINLYDIEHLATADHYLNYWVCFCDPNRQILN